MRSILVILLLSAVALNLVLARTLSNSDEYPEVPMSDGSHPHSNIWPCDVADHPQAYVLMHKVEKRLERIQDEQLRNRIKDYVLDQLRQCKWDGQMDEHCVKRSIGYAMSFISHQKNQAHRY
ncbi:hypothetical protein KR009_002075 [Drosophila setifemur]|nr:hypothetical protein KR009_002075 [Drosophila setifemur]